MNYLTMENMMMFMQTWSNEQLAERIKGESWGFFAHLAPIALYAALLIALIALVMSILNLFKVPGAFKKALFGVLGLGLLIALAYFMAGGIPADVKEAIPAAGDGVWKLASAGVAIAAILGAIALILLLFDLIKGLFKL